MRYYKMPMIILCSVLCCLIAAPLATAQRPEKHKFRERIEDLRKVKLIDILNLQGDQLEKFFGTYNRLQKKVVEGKEAMDGAARELFEATENNASDADVKTKTDNLLAKMKEFENAINVRHAEIRSLLNTQQYARYLAFEARFQEELQKQIIQRVRKHDRDRD